VFSELKSQGAGDINMLAGAIGEALATTALGLMVAIPAVWIYNYFTAQQDQMATRIGNAASQMVDEIIRRENAASTAPALRAPGLSPGGASGSR